MMFVLGATLGVAVTTRVMDHPDPVAIDLTPNLARVERELINLIATVERGIIIPPDEPNIRISPKVKGMLTPEISRVLILALVWSVQEDKVIDINSLNDSKHMVGSLHYQDWAIDLDIAGDRRVDLEKLGLFLISTLPEEYDVIIGRDHVHVEWDTLEEEDWG
jgi:hypothetical protein